MPRKKRVWYPGAIYHVMNRGNGRHIIFKEESDYCDFLECLAKTKEKYPFKVHALCLMTNHFHIVIETAEVEIWKIMRYLQLIYAANYNIKYKLTGHLFGNRYVGKLIMTDRYFLEVSRYIHLNPVKAMMVSDPAEYKYSSYAVFVTGGAERPRGKISDLIAEVVDTSRIYGYYGSIHDDPQEQYRRFVEDKMSHEEQEKLIMNDMGENEMWLPE